jgi:ABC-2 type transport system ATP-binding protein
MPSNGVASWPDASAPSRDGVADLSAVELLHLTKRYRRYGHRALSVKRKVLDWLRGRADHYQEFAALVDVSLAIRRGESVAIIGPNGAGKSTLLRLIAGIAEPDAGTIHVRGRVTPLLELGAGFEPELSGRRNVYLYGALLGLSQREVSARLPSITAFAAIGEFLDTPVKHYSSGMHVRLAFAVAAHADPDILLLDEVLAVGDAAFRAKCRRRMDEFRRAGHTIVLVTHDLEQAAELCDRAVLVDHGRVLGDGAPAAVLAQYRCLPGVT